MENVVKETLLMENCPRAKEIEEKCQLIELKKILLFYNLRDLIIAEKDYQKIEFLVYYVLRQNKSSAVDDALRIVSFYPQLLDEIHVYLFRAKFLVEENRMEELVQFVKRLPLSTSMRLTEELMIYAEVVMSSRCHSKMEKALYCVACCDIIRLLVRLAVDKQKLVEYKRILEMMENISALQLEFDEYLSMEEYASSSEREEVLKRFIEGGKKNKKEKKIDLNSERKSSKKLNVSSVYRISQLLKISREDLFQHLAMTALLEGDLEASINACYDLCMTTDGVNVGCVLLNVAHALCNMMADNKKIPPKLTPAIHHLSQKALSLVKADLLPDGLQLCKITRLAISAWNQCESGTYKSTVENLRMPKDVETTFSNVDDVFVEDGLVLDSQKILHLVFSLVPLSIPHLKTRNGMAFLQNRIEGCIKFLPQNLDSIFRVVQKIADYLQDNAQIEMATGFTMVTIAMTMEFIETHFVHVSASSGGHVEDEKKKSEILSQLTSNVGLCLSQVQKMSVVTLGKVLLHRIPDLPMVMTCLCFLPKLVALDCLKKLANDAGYQYKRLGFVAQAGLAFCQLTKQINIKKTCQEMLDNARWGYRLAKLKISFREAFQGGKDAKLNLMSILVENNSISFALLKEYCTAFGLNTDEAFLYCLNYLMKSSSEKDLNDRCTSLSIANTISRASNLCKEIEKTSDLIETLKNIFKNLDHCDYDRIEFVVNQLESLRPSTETSRHLKLLSCLKTYRRNKTSLSQKLPFHRLVTGDHWSVITTELNDKTVEDWIPMSTILGLPLDAVLATAIRNIIKKYVDEKKLKAGDDQLDVTYGWKEESVDQNLFNLVSNLLTKIIDCELAVASAVWIIRELPTGADKVIALRSCVAMAQKWHAICPESSPNRDKAHKTWTEHSALHRKLMIEQILRVHRLIEPDLLALCHSPAKLIFKLYEHESILNKSNDRSKIDIHSIANQIANINKINVEKIRKVLIEQWLPSSLKSNQENADITMMPNCDDQEKQNLNISISNEDEENKNLLRVIYILQSQPTESSIHFLFNFAYQQDVANVTYLCRVRALQCMLALTDVETIEGIVTFKKIPQIRENMKTFLYLAELDRLELNQTLESFERLNKEGLVRRIWRNHNHDVDAVSLVSHLCLDYAIKDEELWSCIVQKMMSFRCLDRLFNVFDHLSMVPAVWHLPFVLPTLCHLLSSMLVGTSAPLSDDKLFECLHLYSIVGRCPTALRTEVIQDWIDQFKRLELFACALSCVLLLPPAESKQKQLNQVLNNGSIIKTILHQLSTWTNVGYTIPLTDLILEYASGGGGDMSCTAPNHSVHFIE